MTSQASISTEAPSMDDVATQELAPLDHPHRMEPFDHWNRALVQAVHPSNWTNPTPSGRYHLVVVGAGTGGLVSAAIAASLGGRVALIERHHMGGDCLNIGCVPSKGVIRAARAWHQAREAEARFGGPPVGDVPGDFGVAMERMRRLRAGIAPVDSAERFKGLGVDVYLGDARFTGPDTVEVGGATLTFRRAIIATGGRASMIPVPGLDEVGVLTNETVFSLTELPPRLLVIGGGPIGCELAQSFRRMGSEVTVVHADPHLLPREDADAARIVEEALVREGVRVLNGVKLKGARREGELRMLEVEKEGRALTLEGDAILLAAGRTPNVDGLGLEAAGVEYTRKGITVDDQLRTSSKRIWAVGDVATPYQFTHVADHMARIAVQNALFFGRKKFSDLVIPWVTYTSPEVAHVGHTLDSAAKAGIQVDTVKVALDDVDRAILDGEEEGFLKVHVEKGKDRIVGATLVAEHAGEMIGTLTLAITKGIGLGGIAGIIQPYPTQADVIVKAANQWRKGKLTPTVKRVFAFLFRITG
jgi:pyruvate/2-oxoglutarate dehydrogenase complex dihydrolipoamide dehydrogenase (E3) component